MQALTAWTKIPLASWTFSGVLSSNQSNFWDGFTAIFTIRLDTQWHQTTYPWPAHRQVWAPYDFDNWWACLSHAVQCASSRDALSDTLPIWSSMFWMREWHCIRLVFSHERVAVGKCTGPRETGKFEYIVCFWCHSPSWYPGKLRAHPILCHWAWIWQALESSCHCFWEIFQWPASITS